MLSRSAEWWRARRLTDSEWSRHGRGPLRRLVVDVGDDPAAYALYRQSHSWEQGVPGGTVHVIEAIGATPEATRALWRYLCDIDLMEKVSAWMLPVDHPLVLLSAEPRRLGFRLSDGLWVRLVDVGAALAARAYSDADAVTLEVADDFCQWNAGRWRVSRAGAERTDEPPDVELGVTSLASAYLGGFGFAALGRAGLATELRDGGLRRADALFVRDRAPWCPEIF
jgi:predicted acetyltransferase